ncbi:hypothetical protein DSC45_32185 [Streptomyces sp. YIM 130001]|uniref:hypothetical protein n=1 Tax=Streptomyces sp. YIM 130001 TaxID=2259644 RepID=UPI000ED9A22E|nr:hypothetical protein [Streptomyces sp. YIM 130001]RII09185.1 hypothetical protein DSC45_32185 [Streptomyces sp. YIM 130001]
MSTQRPGEPGPEGHEHGQHGGNEAVNGPWNTPFGRGSEDHAPDAGAAGPDGPDIGGPGGPGGLDADEEALRAMMRGAVREIEPSDASLERLRRAVPVRRARKRQAVVGMAAAALFVGTAVPALLHVTNSPGSSDDHPSAVGHTSQVPGDSAHADGGRSGTDEERPSGKDGQKDKDGDKGKGKGGKGEETGGGATAGTGPSDPGMAPASTCGAGQLGNAVGTVGEPAADGKVYGSFRVSNVSASDCTVGGGGSVTFEVLGSAERAKVGMAEVAAGDSSVGLPAAPAEGTVRLAPGEAYEVHFAWVPSETCPTEGSSPDPTPSEGGTGGGDQPATEPQLAPGEGTADGSVALSHTAQPGAPSAAATIPNACAGTVYRTGVMAAS